MTAKYCCCCIDLRTGGEIIALFEFVSYFVLSAIRIPDFFNSLATGTLIDAIRAHDYSSIILLFLVLNLFISAFLLYGIYKVSEFVQFEK